MLVPDDGSVIDRTFEEYRLGIDPVVAAWLLASFFLSVQHATLPLIFDWPFILWRAFMFLPFALILGAVLAWRPRLLPYLMVGHFLIDAGTVAVYLVE